MTSLPEELECVSVACQAALREPHGPDVDHVVDAVLALSAYVERMPRPSATSAEPDRESILTDPKAIAARHDVNVCALLDRIEVATVRGDGVPLGRNEALFLLDLLQVLGFE